MVPLCSQSTELGSVWDSEIWKMLSPLLPWGAKGSPLIFLESSTDLADRLIERQETHMNTCSEVSMMG